MSGVALTIQADDAAKQNALGFIEQVWGKRA